MTSRVGGIWSLLLTGMRGLRSRLLLTLGSVLLAAISIGAAVVGPMYQSGAAASFLVTKLGSEPLPVIGMRLDYTPTIGAHEETYPEALDKAGTLAAGTLNRQFEPATLSLWTHRLSGLGGLATLMAAPGSCDHVQVEGRCPTKPDEAMILKADSDYAHVKIGQEVTVDGFPTPLNIVGIYRAHPFDRDYWYDPTDLQSVPPQPTGSNGPPTPYLPAPLIVTPQAFDKMPAQTWYVKATRRLDVSPQTSVADLRSAEGAVASLERQARSNGLLNPVPGQLTPEQGNELLAVGRELRLREATSRSTVAPAVVSVILVALVLLVRLLSAAMDLRRSELALASLRGFSRRQMWLLGMVEPVLMMSFAVPIGAIGGILCAQWLAGLWLADGIPLPVGTGSLLALLAVFLVTLAVAALVVRESLSEPLSAQIAGVRRPGRSGRWSLLLQIVLVGAAVAVLIATLAHTHKSSPDATDLALPILLAVAAGLLITLLVQWTARRWAGWTSRRRGVFGYVASRTISRRREGTLVILPLTAALAVAIFSAGVFTAAADWRASDAATIVGADRSYETGLTLDQAVALTHQLDPAGKWIMAVGANYTPDGEKLVVDAPRLARVGIWPSSWTPGWSAEDVAREIGTKRPSVLLSGSRVALTMNDQVQGEFPTLTVDLTILRPDGTQTDVILGPFRHGESTASRPLPGCRPSCLVKQLSIGGPSGLPQAMHGNVTITDFRVDGKPVPAALDQSWRASQQLLNTPSGVAGQPTLVPGGLSIDLASTSGQSFAAITPDDVPLVRPVVVGRTAHLAVERRLPDGALQLHTDASIPLDVRSVAPAESMPVLGPTGMLIDYTMLTRDVALTNPATFVHILARSDTPQSVITGLADHGINEAQTLTSARDVLDNDAFALALNLYLVVTVIVVLLALAGLGANLAVQMPARRRDAASLRVVGLRRRSIMAAVIAEFVVVLGAAAVAGIAAGALAQYVVVRTVTLGYADTEHTPRLLASLNLSSVSGLLAVVALGLLGVAVLVAGLTVRGARTASLRENAR